MCCPGWALTLLNPLGVGLLGVGSWKLRLATTQHKCNQKHTKQPKKIEKKDTFFNFQFIDEIQSK